MKNRFIVIGITLAAVLSISRLGVSALQISTPHFVTPVFKAIFLKAGGDDTQPTGVKLDGTGIYVSDSNPSAIEGQNAVLRLNGENKFVKDFAGNSSFASGSIGSTNIMTGSITTMNISNLTITNNNIQNATLVPANFDPSIVRPAGGRFFYTNSICNGTTAIVSASNGNITCATLPTGGNSLPPTCGDGGTPVYTGGHWDCELILLGAHGSDPYWTGSETGNISNSNDGNVGIATTSPTEKLNVSGAFQVDQETEDSLYCYANDTWVPVSQFNHDICMGCQAGYSYSSTSQMCEKVNCDGGGGGGPKCLSNIHTPNGQLNYPPNFHLNGIPPDAYRDGSDGHLYVNGMLDIDTPTYDIVIKYANGMNDAVGGAVIEQAAGLNDRFYGSVFTPWATNFLVEINEPGLPGCTMYRYNF